MTRTSKRARPTPCMGMHFDAERMAESDQCNEYASILRWYRPRGFSKLARAFESFAALDSSPDSAIGSAISDTMDSADDLLTQHGRTYGRNDYLQFGAFEGSGLVGYSVDVDSARNDADIVTDDLSELPRGFTGLAFHVNDHGNCTLYRVSRGRAREIFGVA